MNWKIIHLDILFFSIQSMVSIKQLYKKHFSTNSGSVSQVVTRLGLALDICLSSLVFLKSEQQDIPIYSADSAKCINLFIELKSSLYCTVRRFKNGTPVFALFLCEILIKFDTQWEF